MIKKTNPVRPALFAALLCGVSALSALAQSTPGANPAPGSPGGPPPPPDAQHHLGPPPSPLFDALDTNHDGVISAEEIANASAALKALLKPGSDHLTREDLRPAGAPPFARREAGDEAAQRPKIGAIRPHGPPPAPNEEHAAGPDDAPRMHPPGPGLGRNEDESGRPHFRREWSREGERSSREHDEENDDAQPPFRRERMSGHRDSARSEDFDRPDDGGRPPRPEFGRPRPGSQPDDQARPQPPASRLFDALDTNHDGTISADEIANAPAALKGLLKNGSDHLTRDDLRPVGAPARENADGRSAPLR